MTLIRLALAGDARATFTLWSNCHWQLLDFNSLRGAPPGGEGLGAPASAMPYVIRRTLEKVSYNLLKYFARGETTKFIRPILWEMTFFASEP